MCAWRRDSSITHVQTEADGTPIQSRRSFLGVWVGVGSALVGSLLAVPLMRFAVFPLLRRTTEVKRSPLGPVDEFAFLTEPVIRTIQIEQVDGWRKAISEKAVYITKDQQAKLRVLSSVCPHLGCTIPWNKERGEFVCPCHGGTYAADGTYVSGPALRGMDPLETSVEDGQLMVRFQYFRQLISDREVIG
jgi:menaquinol-cytochrome c reductase iron-sulfur subunit